MEVKVLNNPMVSIIVPVYNVEKYLGKCINSLLQQTYSNIQIILINDGSTDSSGNICNKYSDFDKRIFVLHKQNEGVSAARNAGIDISIGEYLLFVDSDDWLEANTVAELIEKKYGYPVFFLNMDFWYSNDLEILEDRIKTIADCIT